MMRWAISHHGVSMVLLLAMIHSATAGVGPVADRFWERGDYKPSIDPHMASVAPSPVWQNWFANAQKEMQKSSSGSPALMEVAGRSNSHREARARAVRARLMRSHRINRLGGHAPPVLALHHNAHHTAAAPPRRARGSLLQYGDATANAKFAHFLQSRKAAAPGAAPDEGPFGRHVQSPVNEAASPMQPLSYQSHDLYGLNNRFTAPAFSEVWEQIKSIAKNPHPDEHLADHHKRVFRHERINRPFQAPPAMAAPPRAPSVRSTVVSLSARRPSFVDLREHFAAKERQLENQRQRREARQAVGARLASKTRRTQQRQRRNRNNAARRERWHLQVAKRGKRRVKKAPKQRATLSGALIEQKSKAKRSTERSKQQQAPKVVQMPGLAFANSAPPDAANNVF